MTGVELKAALLEECPVIHTGITYQKITALIYRKAGQGKSVRVSAELLDPNGRAVAIAPVDKIERGNSNAKI